MKKTLHFFTILLVSFGLYAQSPQAFNYQSIVRDMDGNLVTESTISFKISIIKETLVGPIVYIETHLVETDQFGLVGFKIGAGAADFGTFADIEWGSSSHYLKIEMDATGGTAYLDLGTMQFLSVPYALYANDVLNKDDADADPGNELQTISKEGLVITLSDGGGTFTDSIVVFEVGNGLMLDGDTLKLSSPDPDLPVPIFFQGEVMYVFPNDYKDKVPFGKDGETDALSLSDGLENTRKVIDIHGFTDVTAASVCANLVAFGLDDWYLPSLYELDAIYKNSNLLKGLDYFGSYWSSTEEAKNSAFSMNFNYGYKGKENKGSALRCRCVRRD